MRKNIIAPEPRPAPEPRAELAAKLASNPRFVRAAPTGQGFVIGAAQKAATPKKPSRASFARRSTR